MSPYRTPFAPYDYRERSGTALVTWRMSTTARLIMSDFRRRGFIRASYGMLKVARIWHGATFSEFEDDSELNGHGPLTAAKLAKLADYTRLVSIIAERLRPFLQDGEVRSFLFNRQLRNFFQKVPCEYWANPESAGMLMRFFLRNSKFGRPCRNQSLATQFTLASVTSLSYWSLKQPGRGWGWMRA
jgi:hypothetical protein